MGGSKILRAIDNASEWTGRVAAFAYLAILLIQVMDVMLRYIFNQPTIWSWDVNAQLFIGASILGGGYVLLHDAHVRVDVLYSRMGERKKAFFDLITLTLLILVLGVLVWQLADMTLESWQIKEHGYSLFAPPLYPVKTVFLLGVFLLLMQSVSHACRKISSLKKARL